MRRRLLFFTIAILVYVLHASVWAQETGQPGGSISGTLLMLDDKTPHVAVPVEAVRDGEVVNTVLSNEIGKYRFIDLEPGQYQLRCQVLGGYVYYRVTDDPLCVTRYEEETSELAIQEKPGELLHIEHGRTLKDVDFRFAPFKKGTWKNYTSLDGLANSFVRAVHVNLSGIMWFGTNGGVSRYDGETFVTFTTKDGLLSNIISTIHRDPDGTMWFGTDSGISRYDGKEFVNFTTKDGLVSNNIWAIHRGTDGDLWLGTNSGVSCYDGREFVNFTTEDGLAGDRVFAIYGDPDGVMWFGTNGGVSRYDGKEFINFTESGLVGNRVWAIYRDLNGVMWFGTNNGVFRYDGRGMGDFPHFVNFTIKDGLVNKNVYVIYGDPDGVMWFGTYNGVSRYDGKTFVNFATKDGLVNRRVYAIYRDSGGVLWFVAVWGVIGGGGGVSRYDEETFVNLTVKDGLVGSGRVPAIYEDPDGIMWFGTSGGVLRYDGEAFVNLAREIWGIPAIHRDPDGVLWFGARWGGVFRYDGKEFVNFTEKDGLANRYVMAVHGDPDGTLWFGTDGGGVSRYDGKEFVNFTTEDGLAGNNVWAIHRGTDGDLWLGTHGGVSCYDGKEFVNFTTEDGLVDNRVLAIHRGSDDALWFGTAGGVSRYDGKEFVNFTTEDGLAESYVRVVYQSSDDDLWFGTVGSGVSRYDGIAWSSLDMRDGLVGNDVLSIHQDKDGCLWFGTDSGITRYRRSASLPKVTIISVRTDRGYMDIQAVPSITTGNRVTFKYNAVDFKTLPEKRQYRYRIKAFDKSLTEEEMGLDWLSPTRATSFDHTFDEPGNYIFEVQAIDRDLNYSEPASIKLTVVSPLYLRAVFLIPTIGSGTVLLAILVILATALTKRRRQVHSYQQAAVNELRDAREMQLSLLPEVAPVVEDMEIAGRSTTANTVGGDFFDYLSLPDGKVGVAVADVSGKGLRAAMNAVLASGMLYEVVKTEVSCGSILSVMNAGLYPRTEKQMFTAFSFAILEPDAGMIQWSNAAQPLPLIKRGDRASEAEEDGELPLGMASDVEYPDYELKLQTGDTVVFYTDGIIEAENEAEEMYGTERLINLVSGIDVSASAEDVIEAIMQDVDQFVGNAEQYDDMTIVVVRKLENSDAS